MAIRLPLVAALAYSNQTVQGGGPTSVGAGVVKTFFLPQDADNVVVKLTASIMSGGISATFQTTDDGGTTWWDVAKTSIVSNANATVTAEWLSIPVVGMGVKTGNIISSTVAVGSVQAIGSIMGSTGRAGASTLGAGAVSGLPIMSTSARIFLQYTGTISSIINEAVTVYTNSQTPQP